MSLYHCSRLMLLDGDIIEIENAPFTDPIMMEASRVLLLKADGQLIITIPSPGSGVFESIAKRFNLKLQSTVITSKADGAGCTFEIQTAAFSKPKK